MTEPTSASLVERLLAQWQKDQSEWFDPTTLEVVSEYATWREAALNSSSDVLQGWRPIETAPKDGTPILLAVRGWHPERPTTDGMFVTVGRWLWSPDAPLPHEEYPDHGGFLELNSDWDDDWGGNIGDRFWMPLPAAPGEARPEPTADYEGMAGEVRRQGQEEGFAAAVQWLRDRSAMKPPVTLWHAASLLADQMERSRIACQAPPTEEGG